MSTSTIRTTIKTHAKAFWVINNQTSRDVTAFCPKCKALETLSLNGEGMVPTRRFTQKASEVYHTRGSDLPCRLFSLS